jgi:hypothetical protein
VGVEVGLQVQAAEVVGVLHDGALGCQSDDHPLILHGGRTDA